MKSDRVNEFENLEFQSFVNELVYTTISLYWEHLSRMWLWKERLELSKKLIVQHCVKTLYQSIY